MIMQRVPVAPPQAARPTAIGSFVSSSQVRAGYALIRLFNGDVPPTLSIRDQLAVAVAERIIAQRLPPGTRIREQLLADEFNVSKAPVSEALMLLKYTGLVESSAHRSAFVSRISVEDFEDLVQYRSTLARTFVPQYVKVHSRHDSKILEQYVMRMAELLVDDSRAFEFVEMSDRCFLFVAMQAGNRRIARTMSSVSLQLLRYFGMTAKTVKQRRYLLKRWNEAITIIAARSPEQMLAHFEQTLQAREDETRCAIREAA
jgi:DNA-binding GntR family transcriptional regulator